MKVSPYKHLTKGSHRWRSELAIELEENQAALITAKLRIKQVKTEFKAAKKSLKQARKQRKKIEAKLEKIQKILKTKPKANANPTKSITPGIVGTAALPAHSVLSNRAKVTKPVKQERNNHSPAKTQVDSNNHSL